MKFIGKLLLTLLMLLVVLMTLLYLALHTNWAAAKLSHWVNNNSQYQLSLEKIDHSWSQPKQLRLINVKLSPANKYANLDVQQVVLGFSWQQITNPLHFRSLLLENGSLNLETTMTVLPIQADILQLNNISFNIINNEWPLSVQQMNAKVVPWFPHPNHVLGSNSTFKLNATSLDLNGIAAGHVQVDGETRQNNLILNNFSAEVTKGTLVGNTSRATNGSWSFGDLRLSNIRMQPSATLNQLWQLFTQLPSITFKRFDLVNARLEGVNWAFNDLNCTLQNVAFYHGNLLSDDGTLILHATDIIKGTIHLIDPGVALQFSPDAITIKQFTTRWEGGSLTANGRWMQKSRHLQLNEMTIAALEYTLPTDWKQLWQQPLPAWLAEISVTKLSASRNLLIDVTPEFPFQITALDGHGDNLLLASKHQWGLWSGTLTANARNVTFNKNDLRHPTMALTANDQQITFSDLSASTKKGLLEATATISQQNNRQFSLQLNGGSVETNILHNWGWPLLPLQGDGDLMLQLTGNLANEVSFKTSLNGSLQATDNKKQQIKQMIKQGEVINVAEQ